MAKFTLDESDLDHLLGTGDADQDQQDQTKKRIPAQAATLAAQPMPKPVVPPALQGAPKSAEIPAAPEIPSTPPPAVPMLSGAPAEIPKPTRAESNAAGKREYAEGLPTVTASPGTPEYGEQRQAVLDYKNAHPLGADISAQPGIGGKILHGLATAGNIAGDIVAPSTMGLIPGTQLNKDLQAKGNANWTKLGADTELKEAQTGEAQGREWAALHPQATGKTPDEQTFASLLTQVNPATNKNYTPMEAFTEVNKAKQEVKPVTEQNTPVGDAYLPQHMQQLKTLEAGMPPEQAQQFEQAYGITGKDTGAVATKRLEDAKAAAALSGAERDRKIAQDTAKQNHADQQANLAANRGLESVQYKDKNGNMISGSYNDAVAAGAEATARKISPEDDKANRMVYAQFGRWQENIGNAADTMKAWDNPADKNLALRVMHNVNLGIHTGVLNVDTEDLQNAMLNNADYAAMSKQGQQHMQNMYQLWSDAINLMKTETGGVPRGEHFLKLESAIMPQPEKTQDQNRAALNAFSRRILDDTKGHVRPTDMDPVVPYDAQGVIKGKDGRPTGYVDANGARQNF